MSYQVHHIYKIILFILIVISVVSCGGGGSTPPPHATDKTSPHIVTTKPGSEQIEIKTSAFIEVTFNEEIANVDTNQIDIYPYNINGVLSTKRIRFKQDPFSYNS